VSSCGKDSRRGGAKELVKVWAQALWDLVLTALKERATTAARRYASYLSVDPRIAVRAAARAMVAVVLVAVGVTGAGLWQTPTYEASAGVQVGREAEVQKMMLLTDSHLVAEEFERRFGFGVPPEQLQANLTARYLENTNRTRMTYEDTNPRGASRIAVRLAVVFSDLISDPSAARLYKERVPDNPTPVSPHPLRNGLLTLVVGLALCAMLALALPRPLAAKVAGNSLLGGRIRLVRQGVGQAGIPAVLSAVPSEAERSQGERAA